MRSHAACAGLLAGLLALAACRPAAAPTPTATALVGERGQADLRLEYRWLVRYYGCAWGDGGEITMYVSNAGTGDAGPFSVSIAGEAVRVEGLLAGASSEVTVAFEGGPVGSIPGTADVDDEVVEVDETNNEVLIVFTPPPACVPASGTPDERVAGMLGIPPASQWSTFRAAGLYRLRYPAELYSVREGSPSVDALWPGIIALEPNEALNQRSPRAVTYKISVAVRESETGLSLDQAVELLSTGLIIGYDPALLEGRDIQNAELGGAPALRVQELPVGPAGLSLQVLALRDLMIYEIVVEPYQVQRDPDLYLALLVEPIIASFEFE
jgi:hypothetical protein